MVQAMWRRAYGWLVAALPSAFRSRNGAELRDAFDRRSGSARGWARQRVSARECADLAVQVVRLRLRGSGAARRAGSVGRRRAGGGGIEPLWREVRQVARGLVRSPGFSLSVLATLGLGIGAVAAVFNLAYGLWLKPLPYEDPASLVTVRDTYQGVGATVSAPALADYGRMQSLAGLEAYHYGAVIVDEGEEPTRLVAFRVTSRLFELLGVQAALGRTFVPGDAAGENGRVMVLSDRVWRERFGADPGMVGRTVRLRGAPATVVGVMPPAFDFPLYLPSEVWLPFDLAGPGDDRDARMLMAVGRLRPGATEAGLAAELATVSARLADAYPASHRGWVARARPLIDEELGSYRSALALLLAMVTLLVGIATANVAGLFLARHAGRARELMVRAALGASVWRLRRWVLMESVLLALAAGALGVAVAYALSSGLAAMLPSTTPRLRHVQLGAPVLGCALVVSLAAGVLAGLGSTGKRALAAGEVLRAGRGVRGASRQRLRMVLLVGELALSLVLVVAAGSMGRAFLSLVRTDRGFEPDGLLTMHVTVPFDGGAGGVEARALLFERMAERLEALPGIAEAALVTGYPGSGMGTLGGGPVSSGHEGSSGDVFTLLRSASPSYFATMQTALIEGRSFTPADRPGAPAVAIVNEALAQRLWPGTSAVGRRLPLSAALIGEDVPVEVVGVVADMRLATTASPALFLPTAQYPAFWTDVLIRTTVAPMSVAAAVRTELRALEPRLLIEGMEPMTAVLADRMALERTQSALAALFGALATILSAVGVYGLLAHLVNQRVQEIGVRRAVGARAGHILGLIVLRGMRPCVAGVAVGGAAALALQRFVASRVFGLSELDPAVVAGAAGLLLLIALVSCWLPAHRAVRIDPLRALR
jgi:putative ABC transport system permease protein